MARAATREEKIKALEKEVEEKTNRIKLMKNEERAQKRKSENRNKYTNGGNLILIDKKNNNDLLSFSEDTALLFGVLTNRMLLKQILIQRDFLKQEGAKRMMEWNIK